MLMASVEDLARRHRGPIALIVAALDVLVDVDVRVAELVASGTLDDARHDRESNARARLPDAVLRKSALALLEEVHPVVVDAPLVARIARLTVDLGLYPVATGVRTPGVVGGHVVRTARTPLTGLGVVRASRRNEESTHEHHLCEELEHD
tara:strand:- start:2261 stop:2710 length:450 start_codon:yes stop_codon:yes gene_type:complete